MRFRLKATFSSTGEIESLQIQTSPDTPSLIKIITFSDCLFLLNNADTLVKVIENERGELEVTHTWTSNETRTFHPWSTTSPFHAWGLYKDNVSKYPWTMGNWTVADDSKAIQV